MAEVNDQPLISVTGVSERDIDLLLLEEFVSSHDFIAWFLVAVGIDLSEPFHVTEARMSVTDSTGESDLYLIISDASGQLHGLLIENKISAQFQPGQAKRYQARASILKASEGFASATTILAAPERYLGDGGDAKGFDSSITYEQIVEWFQDGEKLGSRENYKIYMLEGAIEKAVRGYQLEEDASVTNFWWHYWRLSLAVAPELEMPEPVGKPSSSTFAHFNPNNLPSGVRLVHKMTHGNLDIQFSSMGESLDVLRDRLGDKLKPGMFIARAAKSGVIRQKVPVVSPSLSFELEEEKVREVLISAVSTLHWFINAGADGDIC